MHIFHIIKREDWSGHPQSDYQASSLKTQGFIHCCTETQIPGVVNQWFEGESDLLLMEIDPCLLQSKLIYENLEGGSELFPHVYGPVNSAAIVLVKKLESSSHTSPGERRSIPIEKFFARSHFIFDEGWFLLTSGDFAEKKFNSMTISWGLLGTMWSLPVAMVAVRYSRHTFQFIDKYDSFSLNSFSSQYRDVLNDLGSHSGREMDKINYLQLTSIPCHQIKSPCYQEAELVLECRKIYWEDMNPAHFLDSRIIEKYPKPDYHRFFIGEVVGIYGNIKYSI
jgi:uncharacterized protein (DUF952 family)/flavin reductase (DIM6/NTAB) family NADH-FMN oxidoreductase RutF